MAENSRKTAQSSQVGFLDGELAFLFGEQVVTRARRCRVTDLDFSPDEIVQATRALRRLSGKLAEQVVMARCLPDDVQTALCMWMVDNSMQAKVLAASGICSQ